MLYSCEPDSNRGQCRSNRFGRRVKKLGAALPRRGIDTICPAPSWACREAARCGSTSLGGFQGRLPRALLLFLYGGESVSARPIRRPRASRRGACTFSGASAASGYRRTTPPPFHRYCRCRS
jgi:hypothetical protein